MTGAEYVAAYLARCGIKDVFLLTGGACVFMVDAIGRREDIRYWCFQHEQGAAMAADAVWKTTRKVGATMATSGPGATNLITGIACNYFDSVPVIHVTGQVNMRDSEVFSNTRVRQTGFQETQIVELVKPITKYAVQVRSVEQLKIELNNCMEKALSGRMGPVLIDVPMDVQQAEVPGDLDVSYEVQAYDHDHGTGAQASGIEKFFSSKERPLVLFGAGVGLAGVEDKISSWLEESGIPFVSSWNGAAYFDHELPGYCGSIGVYGNRGANNVLQNCDSLLVLGSRLDTRQRPGDPSLFAPTADKHVVDVDLEELKKYDKQGYGTTNLNMTSAVNDIERMVRPNISPEWNEFVRYQKEIYFNKDTSRFAAENDTISPYGAIRRINSLIDGSSTVIVDCGATTCWFYLSFHRRNHTIFSNGGCAPISYALSAAIGAAISTGNRRTYCIIGDGGFQNNIQELQTIAQYSLNVTVIILNNYGYGIVKQFQDIYLDSRHDGVNSSAGYGIPNFDGIVNGYGLKYYGINSLEQITESALSDDGPRVLDVSLHPDTPIEPKLEIGHLIHDQTPYLSDEEFEQANRFVVYDRLKLTARNSVSD